MPTAPGTAKSPFSPRQSRGPIRATGQAAHPAPYASRVGSPRGRSVVPRGPAQTTRTGTTPQASPAASPVRPPTGTHSTRASASMPSMPSLQSCGAPMEDGRDASAQRYSVGERLEVLRSSGAWSECRVSAVERGGYVVDVDSEDLSKEIAFDTAAKLLRSPPAANSGAPRGPAREKSNTMAFVVLQALQPVAGGAPATSSSTSCGSSGGDAPPAEGSPPPRKGRVQISDVLDVADDASRRKEIKSSPVPLAEKSGTAPVKSVLKEQIDI